MPAILRPANLTPPEQLKVFMERRPSLKTTPSLVITKAKSEQQHRMDVLETRKKSARNWFESLAARIIAAFEALEDTAPALYSGGPQPALSAPPGRAARTMGAASWA